MVVQIYWNSHRKEFSVRRKDIGIVTLYTKELKLTHCKLKVSLAGRERVLKEKRKNVHTYIQGHKNRRSYNLSFPETKAEKIGFIKYNPYKVPYFFDTKTMEAVELADEVIFKVKNNKPLISYVIYKR